MTDEAEELEVEVEPEDEEEQVAATDDELFISDGEFYTTYAIKFLEVTGAIAAISIAGDILLMKPDGLFYKVEISSKKFRPETTSEAAKVTRIK